LTEIIRTPASIKIDRVLISALHLDVFAGNLTASFDFDSNATMTITAEDFTVFNKTGHVWPIEISTGSESEFAQPSRFASIDVYRIQADPDFKSILNATMTGGVFEVLIYNNVIPDESPSRLALF
jgi:hypothetical protein